MRFSRLDSMLASMNGVSCANGRRFALSEPPHERLFTDGEPSMRVSPYVK